MALIFAAVKNEDLAIKIGTLIAHLRQQAGFSQEGFAYETDIARTHMSLIERGGCALQIETLFKICSTLNLPVKDFFILLDNFKPPTKAIPPRKKKLKPSPEIQIKEQRAEIRRLKQRLKEVEAKNVRA